jgi:hypothetical protein
MILQGEARKFAWKEGLAPITATKDERLNHKGTKITRVNSLGVPHD